MKDDMNQEFIFSYKTDANSGFKDIVLNFGGIDNIKMKTENKFNTFLTKYESEIIKLLSVVDINQLISDHEYISKILMKKVERILTFEEFKLFFKLEKKNKKTKEDKYKENIPKINEKSKINNFYDVVENCKKRKHKYKV